MARARNIKPAFFTNELLGTEDPMVSLTFIGLWCLADKVGILEDRPLRIKAELFPYRDGLDVNGYLTVLARLGFIVRYENDGRRFIQVCNFRRHQSPHNTEKGKGFPFSNDSKSLILGDNGYATVKHQSDCGEITEQKRPDSLIPDSLIPDSLIPDSLIPDSLIPDSLNVDTGFTDSLQESEKPEKQESVKIIKVKDLVSLGVDEQHAKDWLAIRKIKKAPLTQTALAGVQREAAKAGKTLAQAVEIAAIENWAGYKADWQVSSQAFGAPINKQQQIEDANAAVVREVAERERLRKMSEPGKASRQDDFIDTGDVIIEGEYIHAQ